MRSDADLAPEAAGALAVLHARYSDDIHKHVRRLVGDEKEADEVTRAVFARAREELANGGRAPSSLRSWVLAIAQQEAVNRARARPEPRPSAAAGNGLPRAWRGRQQAARPAPQPERPARPATPGPSPNIGTGCASLRYADDPTNRYSRPTQLHRCYAAGYPSPVSLQEQRTLCLTAGFAMCPRLGGSPHSEADGEHAPIYAEAPASPTEAAEPVWPAPNASAAPDGVVEPAHEVVPPRSATNGHPAAIRRRPDRPARQPASPDLRTSDEEDLPESGAIELARPSVAPPLETAGRAASGGVWADLLEDLGRSDTAGSAPVWADLLEDLGRPDTAGSAPLAELGEIVPASTVAPLTFDVRDETDPERAEPGAGVDADYGSGLAAPAEPSLAADTSQPDVGPENFADWAETPISATLASDVSEHVAVSSAPAASPDVEVTSASYEPPHQVEVPPIHAFRPRERPAAQASVSRAAARTGGALRHASSGVAWAVLLVVMAPWSLARLVGRQAARLWLSARSHLRAAAIRLGRLLATVVRLCASAVRAAAIRLGHLLATVVRLCASAVRASAALLVAALVQGARLAKAGAVHLLAVGIRTLQLAKLAAASLTRALVRGVRVAALAAQRLAQRLRSSGYKTPNRATSAATAVASAQEAFVPAARVEVPSRDTIEPEPVWLAEAAVVLPQAPAPVVITSPDAWPDFDPKGMPGREGLAIDEQLLPAILALGQRGVAVTTVVRDQRGLRVRGMVDGRPVSSWYSLDECSQLRLRSAWAEAASAEIEPEPDITPVQRKRSRWPVLALFGLVVVAALSFTAISWPAEQVELRVIRPVPAYADDGTVLWTASPGERYRVLQQDGVRLLALSEASESPRVARLAWFVQGSSVTVKSNRPEILRLASGWAGGLPGLMEDLLR